MNRNSKKKFTVYELRSDRFFDRTGILFQRTNQMELHRIRDYEVTRTLIQRIFGKGNLMLVSRDTTTPAFILSWIDDPENVAEMIRNASEASKIKYNIREAEIY